MTDCFSGYPPIHKDGECCWCDHKCYTKEDILNEETQVCRKCHARFCTVCRLKPFLVEFIDQ